MPKDAPQIKLDATRGYGGEIVFFDRHTEEWEDVLNKHAKEHNLTQIN